jgi:secreted protein with Ig-like and vWFA domain
MTFDYADTAALATEALTEFGAPITRRANTVGAYSPSTGAATSTTADTTRVGALFDYGSGQTLVRGQLVQVSDKRLLVDPTAEVAMTDVFVVNGMTYTVVSIGEINPAGTRVLYDLHVRA